MDREVTIGAPTGTADNIVVSPHSHAFANLPLTLKDTNTDVRAASKGLNSEARSTATKRSNGKK